MPSTRRRSGQQSAGALRRGGVESSKVAKVTGYGVGTALTDTFDMAADKATP